MGKKSARFDLQEPNSQELTVTLKPGMGWAIYTDRGPSGPCGQSMSITCPHSVFAVFPDEASMRAAVDKMFRGGKQSNLQFGVIGEWSTGNGSIVVESKEENP